MLDLTDHSNVNIAIVNTLAFKLKTTTKFLGKLQTF